jgi:hypothetical protein
MTRSISTLILPLSIALGAASLAACGSDADEPEDPAAEACEHMAEGPFAQLTGGAGPNLTAPAVSNNHTAYVVTLPADAPGYVSFGSTGGEFTFFFDNAVDVVMTDASENVMTAETIGTDTDSCVTVDAFQTFDLPVGTYYLGLTSATGPVTIVIEEVEEHEH